MADTTEEDRKSLSLRIEHRGGRVHVIDKADGREILNVAADEPVTWQSGEGCARLTLTLLLRESDVDGSWETKPSPA